MRHRVNPRLSLLTSHSLTYPLAVFDGRSAHHNPIEADREEAVRQHLVAGVLALRAGGRHAELDEEGGEAGDLGTLHGGALRLTLRGEVLEEAARAAVGGVHGADEAPRVGKELADRRGLHGGEELAAVDGAVVGDIP